LNVTNVAIFPFPSACLLDASASQTRKSHGCVVRVEAGSQVSGFALAAFDVRENVAVLASEFVLGADPRATTALWERMAGACAKRGSGLLIEAAAVLDIALWDLKAKLNREPLWRTLGGARPRVNVHLAAGAPGLSDDEFVQRCSSLSRQFGFRAAKVNVGKRSEAAAMLVRVRDSLCQTAGSPPTLMIEGDESWSAKDAIHYVRKLEGDLDLAWIESATRPEDFRGLKRLSDSIRGAVCGGAALPSVHAYLSYLQHRCVDIVQIDIARVGITGAMQVADAAFGFELPVALCASIGNVGAHAAAALPYCMSMEVIAPEAGNQLDSDVRIEGGWAIAGDRTGHGVALDFAALETTSPAMQLA
jgi:L-alanine-DL-glutamate epimerase-like enolase superfamily enzyme